MIRVRYKVWTTTKTTGSRWYKWKKSTGQCNTYYDNGSGLISNKIKNVMSVYSGGLWSCAVITQKDRYSIILPFGFQNEIITTRTILFVSNIVQTTNTERSCYVRWNVINELLIQQWFQHQSFTTPSFCRVTLISIVATIHEYTRKKINENIDKTKHIHTRTHTPTH